MAQSHKPRYWLRHIKASIHRPTFSQLPLQVTSQLPLQVEEHVLEQELPHPLHPESQVPLQLLAHELQQPLQYCSFFLAERFNGRTDVNAKRPMIGSAFDNAFLKNWRLVHKSELAFFIPSIFSKLNYLIRNSHHSMCRHNYFGMHLHNHLCMCHHIPLDMCNHTLLHMWNHILLSMRSDIHYGMSFLHIPYWQKTPLNSKEC